MFRIEGHVEHQMINRLSGIDGCRGGWIVAEANDKLENFAFRTTKDLNSLFAKAGPACLIAIDIPIGLPIGEPRLCDKQARKLLGWPRRNSVFSPPARSVMSAKTYRQALRLNRKILGTGISKQAFCIMPKIREVDALMNRDKQQYIREAHPEVTFAQLNGGPMIHNKKTVPGRAERIAVFKTSGLSVSLDWLMRERSRLGRSQVALDDLVDALACLVTAFHIHAGNSQSLGRMDQEDAKQLVMEIVTCKKTAGGTTRFSA